MAVQLLPETQELIDLILDENEDKQRYEALAKLISAQDKDQLEKYLLDWLDEGDRAAWPVLFGAVTVPCAWLRGCFAIRADAARFG